MRSSMVKIFMLALGATTLSPRVRGKDDTVCFEAESAIHVDPPMREVRVTNPDLSPQDRAIAEGASGGAYLEIPQGAGNPPQVMKGAAVWTFDVPRAAEYALWARVWWEDECGNSFTMRIDDHPPFTFGQDSTVRCWHWVKAPPRLACLSLSPGQHTLIVSNREDGARIDQVLLTPDTRYVPVGIEPPRPLSAEPKALPAKSQDPEEPPRP